jgi:hypothetical protein
MTAVLNTVIHPAQHAGGIFNGFFMADLAAAWPEISDAGTLIKCGNFERASCPGRVFFEDERDVFSSQMLDFNTVFFIGFQSGRQLQQGGDFCRVKSSNFKKCFW